MLGRPLAGERGQSFKKEGENLKEEQKQVRCGKREKAGLEGLKRGEGGAGRKTRSALMRRKAQYFSFGEGVPLPERKTSPAAGQEDLPCCGALRAARTGPARTGRALAKERLRGRLLLVKAKSERVLRADEGQGRRPRRPRGIASCRPAGSGRLLQASLQWSPATARRCRRLRPRSRAGSPDQWWPERGMDCPNREREYSRKQGLLRPFYQGALALAQRFDKLLLRLPQQGDAVGDGLGVLLCVLTVLAVVTGAAGKAEQPA